MGYIVWTKNWSSTDDGTIPTGAQVGAIQSDVAGQVNGNLTNANVSSSAAITESKLSFDTAAGHNHDGSNSRTIQANTFIATHYRTGCRVTRTAAGTLSIQAGHVEIDGVVYNLATNTTLTLATAGDWAFGSEGSGAAVFVYAYNNSGALGFKLSTEAPDLSDTDDNTTETPWRYQKYSSTYYRCVGAAFNNSSGDLDIGSEVNFDASSCATGSLIGTGANQTVTTIWTPGIVRMLMPAADPPANAQTMLDFTSTRRLLTDFTLVGRSGNENWVSAATAGAATTITAQSAGTAGSFTITAATSGYDLQWMAWCVEP